MASKAPDIQNDNFDYYFLEQAAGLRQAQREILPIELLSKIYRKGYRIKSTSTSKLNFIEKLLVLKIIGKRWVLIVEDEEKGLKAEDFYKYTDIYKTRDYGEINAREVLDRGIFAITSTDVVDANEAISNLSVSAAYNYLVKAKTKNYLKPNEYKAGMNFLARFINNYESQRKRITMDTGLTMAEWIVITFLYDGEEKVCSILYKEKFKFSYNSSSAKIKTAFSTLQMKGLIVKYGNKASSKFQITSLGKQKINTIFTKYIVNC